MAEANPSSVLTPDPARGETIADIVGGGPIGKRRFYGLVWAMGALAIVGIVAGVLVPMLPRSMSYRAHRILQLPSDATIVQANGDGGEFGDVYFSVPEPKGPGTRLSEIWTKTGLPMPAVKKTALSRSVPVASPPGKVSSVKSTAKITPAARPPLLSRRLTSGWMGAETERRRDGFIYYDWREETRLQYLPKSGQYHFQRMPVTTTSSYD
jgi:hypothetical protein